MKKTILILHGWGVSGKKYKVVTDILQEKGYTVFAPDLPGFGDTKLLKKEMSVDDYVNFVKNFISIKKLSNIILIGHSFGGRVAIKLSASHDPRIAGLILTGSAGIKPKLAFPKRLVMYVAISLGELFRYPFLYWIKNKVRKTLYFIIGEWDYYRAGDLRETFKRVISEDLISYLHNITIPTLLVWGREDRIIQLSYGKKMNELITNSTLVVVPDRGHKLPYEDPKAFATTILPFLQKI